MMDHPVGAAVDGNHAPKTLSWTSAHLRLRSAENRLGLLMFFTTLGGIAAWFALVIASGRAGLAVYILGMSDAEEARTWAARYLGQPPGQAIDQAAIVALCAVALGILVEISRTLRRNSAK